MYFSATVSWPVKTFEKLLAMMKIDESDETDELAPEKAKIYRPCTGILSHITLLSVSMQSEVLLRPCHDAGLPCLLGCMDHCTVITCTDHRGLWHFTPDEYIVELTQTQIGQSIEALKKVSLQATFACVAICSFQLKSAEAEIYAGVSACCDGKLMQACSQFLVEDGVAKAFFFRSSGWVHSTYKR